MPKSCVAFNCTNRFVKGSGISFHRFPFSNKKRLNEWVFALLRKDFAPTIHSFICSEHFTSDCFYVNHGSRKVLKENAVPSIFDFPQYLKKVPKLSKPSTEHNLESITEDSISSEEINQSTDRDHTYCIVESPRKLKRKYEQIIDKKNGELDELKRFKICKLQVSRKTKKIESLVDLVQHLKEKNLVNSKIAENLKQNFNELSLYILKQKSK